MKVTILRGIPGSGKSTYCKKNYPNAAWYSADYYFINEKGVYAFDPSKLGEAHGYCLRGVVQHLERHPLNMDLVVDNTNTTAVEIAPYAALAQAYGCELEIITIQCMPEVAAARNVHGVPLEGVRRMYAQLIGATLPPWWPHRVVEVP